MKSQEPSCALRALTLCDGQSSYEWRARMRPTPCYCRELLTTTPGHRDSRRQELLTDRARVVARSDDLLAILEFRKRYGPLSDF